jgi:predicted kinase
MATKVLGVDLASGRWRDNGTALLSFGADGRWETIEPGVVRWPSGGRPNAEAIAEGLDAFCLAHAVSAMSLDGPQGWRDPGLPSGWGRAAERASRTPGKTGPPGSCVPGTYLGWVTLSVEVFERLQRLPHVELANDPVERMEMPPPGRYVVLECFPTSIWRTAGLAPLPGKAKTRDTAVFARALATAFGLPRLGPIGHDDLQAVVAALPAAALLGAPVHAVPRGTPGRQLGSDWIEGLIWDAAPLSAARESRPAPTVPLLVVVTGPPASGKTTLATALSRELGLPLVAKDAIKERLYETVGTGDREWSRRLGRATYTLIFHWLEEELRAGRSVIVESNFTAAAASSFAELPAHRALQLFCTASRELVIERYAARSRHAGHLDDVILDELRAGEHEEQWSPLPLAGELLELDVVTAELDAVVAHVRSALAPGRETGGQALN